MRATRLILAVIWILVISGFAVSTVYGETIITVDDSGGANYISIQDAVNNANDGAKIIVHAGTYTENVNVTKPLSIKSESGNPNDTIVLAADPGDHVFYVTADNVTISGFGVAGSNNHGIYLEEVEGGVIANNIVSNNRYGIGMENSDHNDLSNNTANANEWGGIILRHSRYNTLSNNNVFKNKVGINVLHSSQHNEVSNNTASNNSVGIEQALSDNNNLTGNVISKNRYGIFLYKCNSNEITGNTLLSNSDCGIYLKYSDDNDLMGNTVRLSRLGIHLSDYSRNNTVKDNFLSENSEDVRIADDSGNHARNYEIVRDPPPNPVEFILPATDRGLDIDGDSIFDYLVVELAARTSEPGRYSFTGELCMPPGTHEMPGVDGKIGTGLHIIEIVPAAVHLNESVQTVAINFEGGRIRNDQINGPYEVRISVNNETHDFGRAFDHTTGDYGYAQFEQPDLLLSGPVRSKADATELAREKAEELGIVVGAVNHTRIQIDQNHEIWFIEFKGGEFDEVFMIYGEDDIRHWTMDDKRPKGVHVPFIGVAGVIAIVALVYALCLGKWLGRT